MRIYNLTDNDDAAIVAQQGIFQVMEWKRDFSVTYGSAMDAYYASEMNVRRRQLVCNLNGKTGAVMWTEMTTDPADNRFITGAPRVFDGRVIIGHGGADGGVPPA